MPMIANRAEIRSDCYRMAWVTYVEAAHISGLSKSHIYSLASEGKIKIRKRGSYRVDRLSLENYLNGVTA